jgi:hypothetical protein
MRSSRGFASAAANLFALFRLAFASAPRQRRLTLLTTASRRIIMQNAHHHACGCPHGPLIACKRVVSGSLSSPCRGSSHLSLALLGSLSVAREYLALRDGPRGFRPASTCRALLRCRTGTFPLRLRDSHPLWWNIPEHFDWGSLPSCPVLQPHPDESGWFGLVRFRSPLLTESLLLSFPRGTEMFQFPPFAPCTYGFSAR